MTVDLTNINTELLARKATIPLTESSDGISGVIWALRDGAPVTEDRIQALYQAGYGYAASSGSVATPLTFTTYTVLRPQGWIRVPAGVKIIPTYINIAVATDAGTATYFWLGFCQNDVGNGTSTAVTLGPLNMRSDGSIPSACTVRHLATADTTAMTNPVDIKRWAMPGASGTSDLGLEWGPGHFKPLLIGPATLYIYAMYTTTAPTGFINYQWLEFEASEI